MFPVAENRHANGILDVTIAPGAHPRRARARGDARSPRAWRASSTTWACSRWRCSWSAGGLLLNEIAPRPHNSGHYTIDACRTSQFEQQVRVLCGLPLGDPSQHTPAVMVNLLGDIWRRPASRSGRRCCAIRARTCTSTASARRGPGARWATSRSARRRLERALEVALDDPQRPGHRRRRIRRARGGVQAAPAPTGGPP